MGLLTLLEHYVLTLIGLVVFWLSLHGLLLLVSVGNFRSIRFANSARKFTNHLPSDVLFLRRDEFVSANYYDPSTDKEVSVDVLQLRGHAFTFAITTTMFLIWEGPGRSARTMNRRARGELFLRAVLLAGVSIPALFLCVRLAFIDGIWWWVLAYVLSHQVLVNFGLFFYLHPARLFGFASYTFWGLAAGSFFGRHITKALNDWFHWSWLSWLKKQSDATYNYYTTQNWQTRIDGVIIWLTLLGVISMVVGFWDAWTTRPEAGKT